MDKNWDSKVKNLFSLKDKVVVVTGGAGSLGEGVARGLANFGARIVAKRWSSSPMLPTRIQYGNYPNRF
jgi:NADP-dependent 3-hydroxy acid dehydrogenase YdfG